MKRNSTRGIHLLAGILLTLLGYPSWVNAAESSSPPTAAPTAGPAAATAFATEIAGAEPGIGNLALVFLRGGWEVTAVTLSRFFALHVLVLPAVIILFLVAHFFMIRRQGIARPL